MSAADRVARAEAALDAAVASLNAALDAAARQLAEEAVA